MRIEFINQQNYHYLDDVKALIEKCDKEFIPALSSMNSTTQQSLYVPTNQGSNCDAYFKEIASQYILIAIGDKKELIGFMSFKKNYSCEHISRKTYNNLYVTTVIVNNNLRKHGTAAKFYDTLKEYYPMYNIFTRTWSTNTNHISVLSKQGFIEHCRIKDDRGDGIDTVYFHYQPKIKLIKANYANASTMWQLQVKGFTPLFEKYQDCDTTPACESLEKVTAKIAKPSTHYYFICIDGKIIGGINVGDHHDGSPKKIAPLFILPEYQNKGYAQRVIKLVEAMHGSDNWFLATIKQEEANCHLYEKMGYKLTGEETIINDKMTIVGYRK